MADSPPAWWLGTIEAEPDGSRRVTFHLRDYPDRVVTVQPSINFETDVQAIGDALARGDRRYRDRARERAGG